METITLKNGVELPTEQMFFRTIGVRGGGAPARVYLPELLAEVLAQRINPGRVLDFETDLDGIAEAYAAMDERRAIKSLVRWAPSDGRRNDPDAEAHHSERRVDRCLGSLSCSLRGRWQRLRRDSGGTSLTPCPTSPVS